MLKALSVTLCLALLLVRLCFGIDFTDESYWVAMATHFATGGRPFIDELIIHQTASLLFTPFVKIWMALFGKEGIILFCRLLFLALNGVVATLIYYCLQPKNSKTLSLVVALAYFTIIPLQIPGLSYNSIGAAFFTLAIFLPLRFPQKMGITGFCHGIATIAYPTLIIPAMIYAILQKVRYTFWLGLLFPVLVFFTFYFPFPEGMESIRYTLTAWNHGGGIAKLFLVLRHFFWDNVPVSIAFFAIGILFTSRLTLFLLPLLFLTFRDTLFTQMWVIFYGALLAPFCLKENRPEFLKKIWIPSFVAALVIGWSSMSAPINGVVGIVPAFLLLVLSLVKESEKYSPATQRIGGFSILFVLSLSLFSGKAFYRDGDFRDLFARVNTGPFKGLYTTAYKHRFLEEISHDIHSYENKSGHILFYEFPAGYLLSSMPPASNSLWIRVQSRGSYFYKEALKKKGGPNNIAFMLHWVTHDWDRTYGVDYKPNDLLIQFLLRYYHPVESRENYTILSSNPSSDGTGDIELSKKENKKSEGNRS